jgi:hypothetical protein
MTATYETNLNELLDEIKKMLLAKNSDYGQDNLKKHGEVGIRVRLDDKFARLDNLQKKSAEVKEETVDDTWKDIVGYGLQAILLRRGKL